MCAFERLWCVFCVFPFFTSLFVFLRFCGPLAAPALFVAPWPLSSLLVASRPFPWLYIVSRVCGGLFAPFALLSPFTLSVAPRTSVFPRRGPDFCALLSKQPSAILCSPFRFTARLSLLFRLRGYNFAPPLHIPVCAFLDVLHTIRKHSWLPQKPCPPPVL